MDYKKIFSPKTLQKLNKQSADNLKTMLGDKNLIQTLQSSQTLLSDIAKAEAPHKQQLEKLAVNIVNELYPIIKQEGIVLDAKLVGMSEVGKELDEIKVNNPSITPEKLLKIRDGLRGTDKIIEFADIFKKYSLGVPFSKWIKKSSQQNLINFYQEILPIIPDNLQESISPEGRRRIINSITQGSALRGAFSFYLFKEHLDEIDPTLVEKYNQIMKEVFGIYDDPNAVAMMLSMLAQGHKAAGGSSKVIIKEQEQSGITIKARAICFPMLVHELIKGLYELISLQGFKGDKAANQAVVNKVDKLEHEPDDIKMGKFVYDALNNVFASSKYNDPRIREFFFIDVYKQSDDEFISFIENAINEELTDEQKRWVEITLKQIDKDLKDDAYDETGIDEIKVNNPLKPEMVGLIRYKTDLSKKTGKPAKKLDLVVGKYKLSGDEHGVELNWNEGEKFLGGATKKNVNRVFIEILGIQPSKVYIGIVPRPEAIWDDALEDHKEELEYNKYVKSFYIYGEYEGTPIVISRKETATAGAGQTYLVSPTKKDKFTSFLNADKEYIIEHFKLRNLKEQILSEYSEKTIQTTIERWKKENPKVDDNIAKQVIQRFDQIKSSLAQKLNIVSLSDELKKNNNYLNIDKYSFDDMVKLIRSLPENPDKIKKDAVQKFHDREEIDKNLAQSYVARFMAKRDALKQGFENGLEDEGFTKDEVREYIPKQLQQQNAFLDPRNWKWQGFEQMLDALFPSQRQAGEEGENLADTDLSKVYDKDGIEIYKGDDVHKCISYNPTVEKTKKKKYGWCVTQVGNTNYDYYRFGDKAPTFYFVFDRNKTSEPEHAPFKDKWHAFVVQVTADGKDYIVTAADNRGDIDAKGWENVSKIVPSDTWSRIKGLEKYFQPIKLSSVERGRKFASGKSLSLDEFKELDQDEKILYIQGKASKNSISPEIKAILPDYKINLEGRSTTLANVAIDSGQKFSWNELKGSEPLAKRYAIFRFRHTNYSKDPLPLPFIKYLDEEGKAKYLKIFEENLNFGLIEKFFGEKVAADYANKEAENLQYIPEKAIKYLKDDKLKKMYSIYQKLTESWNFSDNFKLDEESISKLTDMPVQDVTPVPINEEQWKKLSTQEREFIISLGTKVNGNSKYSTLLYALPYIVKDGDNEYVLLPKNNKDFTYDKWVLMDTNGKVIKDNISGDATLGENTLITGYPSDNEKINRIYSMKDLKGDKKDVKEIKVNNPNQGFTNEEYTSLIKLKKYFKDVKITYRESIHSPELGLLQWISFITKNGYNINFLKRTPEQKSENYYGDYGFLLGGSQRFEGSLKQLVDYSIKNYKPTNLKENQSFNIPNPDYYQKLLNMSNGLSHSTAKYFQDVINSVKKQNGKASEKQYRILQRIKTGDFNLTTKN